MTDRVAVTLGQHLAHQLHVARQRLVAEAHTRERRPEILAPHGAPEQVGPAHDRVAHLAEPPSRRNRGTREPREQDDAAHPVVGHVAMLDRERLHGDRTHRVPDQDGVAEVEGLEHGADIGGEVLDRMAGVTARRLAVAAVVEEDRPQPRLGQRARLLHPHTRVDRDTVHEHDRGVPVVAEGQRVQITAVVAREPPLAPRRQRQQHIGIRVGTTAQTPQQRPLRRVRGPGDTDRRPDGDAGDLERAVPLHEGTAST